MIRIDSIWSGAQIRGGGITQLFFNNLDTEAQACADAVEDFWTAVLLRVKSTNSVTIASSAALIDPETGTLTGVVPLTSIVTQPGIETTEALPPATQGLIQLRTGTIVGGRELRGRVFLPGMTEFNNTVDGVPVSTFITAMNAAATGLIDDLTANWAVWHRPNPSSGTPVGSLASVDAASVWNQWAVLRSRRD